MELIWFPGNLEIWLRYDFNMPLAEDLFESGAGTLRPPGGSKVEGSKQLILGRFWKELHVFLILFPYYFHIISILFPYYFYIISVETGVCASELLVHH